MQSKQNSVYCNTDIRMRGGKYQVLESKQKIFCNHLNMHTTQTGVHISEDKQTYELTESINKILWHIRSMQEMWSHNSRPLLGSGCTQKQMNGVLCAVRADGCLCNNEIRHAIANEQIGCNRGTVFICGPCRNIISRKSYEQSVRGLLGVCRCELLLLEADGRGRGESENPKEGKRPPLETDTKQWQ
jgi:hypothetical protein